MVQKAQSVRFFLSLFSFTLLTFNCSCQTNEVSDNEFVKTFVKNFKIPEIVRDNCVGTSLFLSVYIEKNSLERKIQFSDNSDNQLKQELEKIYYKLNNSLLDVKFKTDKVYLLYPILFVSRKENCKCSDLLLDPGSLYTIFNGATLDSLCILRNPITIAYYDSNH